MEFEFVAEGFTLKKTPTSKSYYSKHKRVLIRKQKMPTEDIKKIEQEVANLKFLNHRHIVSILDCFSDMEKQHISVVTEPLQFTLRNLINGKEKPNEPLIWRAISHISDGLNYLHEQNPPIIFTDLKPEYIAGIGRFLPKVEWKLLKYCYKPPKDHFEDYIGGTACYLAPEVLRQEEVTPAADMWSLGATISACCNQGWDLFRSSEDVLRFLAKKLCHSMCR